MPRSSSRSHQELYIRHSKERPPLLHPNLIIPQILTSHTYAFTSSSWVTSIDLPPLVVVMEAAASFVSPELRDVLTKVAVFVLVQGLVYLILRNSSNVFSKDSKLRSMSFRPMRSMSVRRVLAPLSDVPVGTDEPSPSPSSTSTRRRASRED